MATSRRTTSYILTDRSVNEYKKRLEVVKVSLEFSENSELLHIGPRNALTDKSLSKSISSCGKTEAARLL
jgi:hypothetical protein